MRGYFLSGLIQRIMILKGKRSLAAIEKNSHDAMGINQKRLMEILRENKNTEYGKKYHFDQIHSVEDYIKQVPLTEYDTYEPYIERRNLSGASISKNNYERHERKTIWIKMNCVILG